MQHQDLDHCVDKSTRHSVHQTQTFIWFIVCKSCISRCWINKYVWTEQRPTVMTSRGGKGLREIKPQWNAIINIAGTKVQLSVTLIEQPRYSKQAKWDERNPFKCLTSQFAQMIFTSMFSNLQGLILRSACSFINVNFISTRQVYSWH